MSPRALLALGALAAGLSGCGAEDPQRASAGAERPSPVTTATPEVEGMLGRPTTVPGQANIYGAGREQPPAPGGGGPGVLPPRWFIPGGAHRIVTFPRITGRVSPIDPSDDNGAAGDHIGPTAVTS